jgi:hypothetical protein
MIALSYSTILIIIGIIITIVCFLWGKHNEEGAPDWSLGLGYIGPLFVWLISIIVLLIIALFLKLI